MMRRRKLYGESGQAMALEAIIAVVAVIMLALPVYEFGRMAADHVLAASAAEDLAQVEAIKPQVNQAFIEQFMNRNYPTIKDAHVEVSLGEPRSESYSHHLPNAPRESNVTFRDVSVTVEVSRPFATAAGRFIGGIVGAKGYVVRSQAASVVDDTVTSGRW